MGRSRIVERWTVDSVTGCWLWKLKVGNSGYGDSWDPTTKSVRKAHLVVYEELVGPIPEGLELDHVYTRGCRHKHCVNPAHLEPVTRTVNIQRSTIAKLTAPLVTELRTTYAAGGVTQKQLAVQYGVSWHTVNEIMRGKTWKNVALPVG